MLLIVMSLVGFIMFLDTTMMNVAITAVVQDLNTNISTVQSAIALYALVMAAFMVAGGKIGEIYGLKKVFIVGMIMYTIGTTMAAFSPNITSLIVGWSIIEGLAVAMLLPITTILITISYTGIDRAKALSIFAAVASVAGALGPIYGGLMTSYLSWRIAFGSELIIVAIIFFLLKYIPNPKKDRSQEKTLDKKGTVLMAIGLSVILLSIMGGSTYGFLEPKEVLVLFGYEITPFGFSFIPFLLFLGVSIFGWFLRHEQKLMDEGREPLLNITILKNKKFKTSVIIGSILAFLITGIFFTLPIFLQMGFQYSAIKTGIALLPMTIALMIFALIFAPLGSRFSPRALSQLGLVVMIFGALVLAQSLSNDLTIGDLIPGLALFGAGVGILTSQITNLSMSSVEKSLTTEASGINNTLRQFGTALGTAIVGSILVSGFFLCIEKGIFSNEQLSENTKIVATETLHKSIQKVEESPILPSNVSKKEKEEIQSIVDNSIVNAMRITLFVLIFFIFIALFLSRKLPKEKFATE